MIDEKQAQAIMNYKITRKDFVIKGGIILLIFIILPKRVTADWLFRRSNKNLFDLDDIAMQYQTRGTETINATDTNTDTIVVNLPRKGFKTGIMIMKGDGNINNTDGKEGVAAHVGANGENTASINLGKYPSIFHQATNTYLSDEILDSYGRLQSCEFNSDGDTVTATWYADGGTMNDTVDWTLHVN